MFEAAFRIISEGAKLTSNQIISSDSKILRDSLSNPKLSHGIRGSKPERWLPLSASCKLASGPSILKQLKFTLECLQRLMQNLFELPFWFLLNSGCGWWWWFFIFWVFCLLWQLLVPRVLGHPMLYCFLSPYMLFCFFSVVCSSEATLMPRNMVGYACNALFIIHHNTITFQQKTLSHH